MCDLTGQTALVTGGAEGIGFGIALQLARAGSRVVVASRNQQRAHAAVERLRCMGHEVIAVPLDVTDAQAVRRCVEMSIQRCSRIDLLVNNAGIGTEEVGRLSTAEDFNCCLEVNLIGVWRMSQALVAHFEAQGGGRIVNIASINGRKPWVMAPAYSASKAAVINLTHSLAVSLANYNINVNAVCPGGVITAMADRYKKDYPGLADDIMSSRVLKRELLPAHIGDAVVFFASAGAANITGQALNVDGGCVMA
jgi:NAD(P)-dependent dehydrogenase (short-subunit alcohol dehydrogenase family)